MAWPLPLPWTLPSELSILPKVDAAGDYITLVQSHVDLPCHALSNSVLLKMSCHPPFYPCPGHELCSEHDKSSTCYYYFVFAGFVRGIFTNSWVARNQTECFTDSRQKAFKTRNEADAWWAVICNAHHSSGCPDFEPLNFDLDVDPRTDPSSTPCCWLAPPVYARSSAAAPSIALPAPSSFNGSAARCPSPFSSPLSPTPMYSATPMPNATPTPSPKAGPSPTRRTVGWFEFKPPHLQ
ncbi:hypothetical protein C8R45DRAFT_1109883 [Mycena sanguinolenta]|nr:hypothetical protein C8R45DRAFT_1109883 [Mycena sanguinolenta]